MEAGFYVGVAFVVAAVTVVVAQQWSSFGRPGQIALITGFALLAVFAGSLVAWPARPRRLGPGGRRTGGRRTGGLRRRAASALLTAGAILAAGDAALIVADPWSSPLAGAVTAVTLLVVGQLLAPTLLSQVALAVSSVFLATSVSELLFREGYDASPQDWQRRQVLFALPPIAVGAAWAWVIARWLRYRALAVSLGLVIMVFFALTMLGPQRTPGSVTLVLIAVATLISYLRDPVWPWLVAAVMALAAVVFIQAGDTLGPAIAFLLAGLVLLVGVGVLLLFERRRDQPTEVDAG